MVGGEEMLNRNSRSVHEFEEISRSPNIFSPLGIDSLSSDIAIFL